MNLPFDFHWFAQVERTIPIGTNGVLTFGFGQLPYGSSEPVPCSYGSDRCDNSVPIDGVIAPLWCDLNPAVSGVDNGDSVFFQLGTEADPRLVAWNKLIVEHQAAMFGTEPMMHFESNLVRRRQCRFPVR